MENDPLIGKQLGAYRIQSKLGEGGMARVYKAYHDRLRRDVAIKVILSQIADQMGFKARFEREAQVIASLEHPNIVAVYDFGESGNLTYLVMQYVGGGTLRDQLRSVYGGHALEPPRAINYALQMARALHHAHLRGIVHRDVKPQNMLVSASNPTHLLLSDFGIAKIFGNRYEPALPNPPPGTPGSDFALTNVDQIVGTAEYMSPEQINGAPVDARSDVYSLGVVLFQMLTGEVPFHSTTLPGLLFQHVYTPPRPIREINPYVPEILTQIVAKALAKAPDDRFQSADSMARALDVANAHATHPLSGTYPIPGSHSGNSSATIPSQNPPIAGPNSNYGQSRSGPNGAGAALNTPLSFQVVAQSERPGVVSQALSAPRQRSCRIQISYISAALVLLLAAGVILARIAPTLTSNPTTSTPQAFTENFHNNEHNWTVGSLDNGNFTASIANGQYMLVVNNISNTYFPHPDTAAVGTLPANFTVTEQMEQTGSTASNNFYGLAFHFTENGSKVYCYALVINMSGNYELLKYDADIPTTPSVLWSGQFTPFPNGINHLHTFRAKVQGNSFSFALDGQAVSVGTSHASTYTDNDSPYTGGSPAVMVTGPNANFIVASVQLAIP